jgi:hypothetical protein
MKTKSLEKNNLVLLIFIFGVFLFYNQSCDGVVFLEYINLKFFDNQTSSETYFTVQLVNETAQNRFCYFTISDSYFDVYESKYLFYTYFPRTARTIIQQLLIFYIVFKIIIKNRNDFEFKNIFEIKFVLVYLIGLILSYSLISNTTNFFSEQLMLNIFIIFSFFKSIVAFLASKTRNSSFLILLLMCYPFTSTGLGIPWFYDFIIYYVLFLIIQNQSQYLKNKTLIFLTFALSASILHPLVNSPSLETLIVEKKITVNENNINQLLDSEYTYLEAVDLESIIYSQGLLSNEEFELEVYDLSRNVKEVTYPHRWKYMVSPMPDTKFHLPALIWYLALLVLFFDITNTFKNSDKYEIKNILQKAANVVIFYQLLSLFFGVSKFFNSFSNLFFLNRNSELITFGEIQTWRGVADHYEVFSNFQVFCFFFFMINYFLNKNIKNFIFIFFPILTAVLSQSRWSVLVIFLILFLLLFLNAKKYLIELTSLIIFTILVLQFVPVFERSDPFFDINTNRDYQSISFEESNDLIGFEIISDPLNRTAPWTMFYEGYKPDVLSFIFGNGPGAYLNLVKNTDAEITSGPHSSVLQILNKFGLLNLLVLVFFLIRYVFNIMKTKFSFYSFIFAIVIGLLISFEIKTDSLMIMDGVYIFGFNLVLIYLIGKLFEERIQKF